MNFDTSPRTLKSLNSIMRSDPRVIRWTMLKLGERIEDVVKAAEGTTNRQAGEATGPKKISLGQGLGEGYGQHKYGQIDAEAVGEHPRV